MSAAMTAGDLYSRSAPFHPRDGADHRENDDTLDLPPCGPTAMAPREEYTTGIFREKVLANRSSLSSVQGSLERIRSRHSLPRIVLANRSFPIRETASRIATLRVR